jgi:hypothetical protein
MSLRDEMYIIDAPASQERVNRVNLSPLSMFNMSKLSRDAQWTTSRTLALCQFSSIAPEQISRSSASLGLVRVMHRVREALLSKTLESEHGG